MENASKALLIAGGVLITVIVLSLLVSLYTLFSKQSKQYADIMEQTEINKFNSNFDVYFGRNDITPQEIVSVVNLAKEYNNSVTIYINNVTVNIDTEEFIKDNIEEKFKCNAIGATYDTNGKITGMNFIKQY